MEHSFHYLMMVTQSLFQKGVFAHLRHTDLTVGQPKVLDHLHSHDGDSQKDIASSCHIEPGSLTTLLKGMSERGLVERRNMNGNRKTTHVFMTEKGMASSQQVQTAFAEMEAIAFEGISETERADFMATLTKIYDNLQERSLEQ
ncbi:MAG: MarR family transcriptional regulator [Peptococcaceae bacterium]|nr:MarR family transcriptional regulator [Peptococcaceae bacterium]